MDISRMWLRLLIIGTIVVSATVVCLVLALGYFGRLAWLEIGATEGDVPDASALGLPEGSKILSQTHDCASGGCWSVFVIAPPAGSSPAKLSVELGVTPHACIPGSFFDPRTIRLDADPRSIRLRDEPRGDALTFTADYWTEGCAD